MTILPGITGTLFPSRFLSSLSRSEAGLDDHRGIETLRAHFAGWWRRVESSCGPATGLRALFDLFAMPLAGLLGYRAHDAIFERDRVWVRLQCPSRISIRLLLLPWASRPSRIWRDLVSDDMPSSWAIVMSPPFLSVVDRRGHAFRRSADFCLPDAIDPRSFLAFWTVCRASTLGTLAADKLVSGAAMFQDEVRKDLELGVLSALSTLGPVLGLPARRHQHEARFSEALTLVYRVLFLLFAEARGLTPVHHPRFSATYTITSLCREAVSRTNRHAGLWDGLAAVTRLSRLGCDTSDFTIRPFNGRLFARSAAPALESGTSHRPTRLSKRRDEALAQALVALATRPGDAGRESISYADLGVEQLGAVYERVLDLDPADLAGMATVSFGRAHSRRRKESGTFYTPQPLAEFVIRRTLAPLVQGASTDEILAVRVVDPAMGSGAFLVAACRFLSDAYEHALIDEGRCAETDLDADSRAGIRRLVAARCLCGVDSNPVAVQLARLSLWLTTLARDKPLSFFDHQLRVGDSLVGAAPDDLWRLAPASHRRDRSAPLFEVAGLESALRGIARPWRELRERGDDTVTDVRDRERLWSRIAGDRSPLAPWRAACDLWCARWFWDEGARAPSAPETRAALDALLREDASLDRARVGQWLETARAIAQRHRFFHWPLEFADLFYGDDGAPLARAGFHAVVGNPPWEMLRGEGGRRDLVTFVRRSGLYPSCDRGHLNLYQPFLERSLSLARRGGRVGLVLPWGLAADEGSTTLRRRLILRERLDSLVGFDNAAGLFPIHRGSRFLALTVSPGLAPRTTHARFGVRTAAEIDALPGDIDPDDGEVLPVLLNAETLRVAGGQALRVPDVRRTEDLQWLLQVSRRFPRLGGEAGWAATFGRELNATEDRGSLGTSGLPVIEGKHIEPFHVRAGETERHIQEQDALRLLPDRRFDRARLAYRDVTAFGNKLTLIAAVIPAGVVTTHTLFCLRNRLPAEQQAFLCALFNSTVLNRIVRMLMGSHVTTGLVESLPVPRWTGGPEQQRAAELASLLSTSSSGTASATAMHDEINEIVERMYR